MAGCNWCGTTEVKLAENKPYCPDCASNCKRECTVCHKPYPNLKFYEKHSKRCNSCQSCYVVVKTKKASIENNRRNSVIQQGNESNMTVMKNLPLLEKKRRRRRRRQREEEEEEDMKLKVKALKKKIAQKMRSSVKLPRRSKSFFYSTFKKTIDCHGDFANK